MKKKSIILGLKNGSFIEFTQKDIDKIKFKPAHKGILRIPGISDGFIYWACTKQKRKK